MNPDVAASRQRREIDASHGPFPGKCPGEARKTGFLGKKAASGPDATGSVGKVIPVIGIYIPSMGADTTFTRTSISSIGSDITSTGIATTSYDIYTPVSRYDITVIGINVTSIGI